MIYIACDHGGYELKEYLKDNIENLKDLGPTEYKSKDDYPVYAKKLTKKVLKDKDNIGILICGTGIGMSIVANKIRGINAALCSDVFSAKYARMHNHSNVLCLGARVLGKGLALEITKNFLATDFENAKRIKRRISMHEGDFE